MIDPSTLIIVGILIIGFGFWWKWQVYWGIKNNPLHEKKLMQIEVNAKNNKKLARNEKFHLGYKNSGLSMWKICSKVGVAMIAIGLILLITQ